jgi:hypothetical protein
MPPAPGEGSVLPPVVNGPPAALPVPGESDALGVPEALDEDGTPDESDEFFDAPSAFPLGSEFGETLVRGLSLSGTFSGTYNSNITSGQPQSGSQGEDDFTLGLGGNLNYLSKASTFTFGANYRGRYDEYLNNSDFSGYSQGGGVVANYKGGRFDASATAGIDANRGSSQNYSSALTYGGAPRDNFSQDMNQSSLFNRLNKSASVVANYEGDNFTLSGNVGIDFDSGGNDYSSATSSDVKRDSIHTGLSGSYRVGPKTSVTGNFGYSTSTGSGAGYGDTSSYNLGVAGMWRYSPRTEFGPGVRYTYSTGDTQQGRSSLGPTLNANYKVSKKTSLTSQVGLNFAEYENGQSADPSVSTSIALDWMASRLWGMNLSLARDVQADPASAGAFYESTSLRVGYHRKIRRAAFNLGMSYQFSDAVVPDGVAGGRSNRDSLNFDSSLGMPIFANTCNASVFARYSDQSGGYTTTGATGDSWDSFQLGFSISRSF